MANKFIFALLMITGILLLSERSFAQAEVPAYNYDRGTGIATSQFGTYVHKHELLIYLFHEYYNDRNLEYEPFDFGLRSTREYRGHYRANESLIFFGYGITDRLAVEFEAGIISAWLKKSDRDVSSLPAKMEKSGLSDVEGQIRWRWNFESARTPEFFNYFEYVLPTGEKNSLIGTSHWELKLGTGMVRGFKWGTMTFRAAIDYDTGEDFIGVGEYAIEYLKRVSNRFRVFAMMEGSEDEIALVPEVQWFLNRNFYLKAGTGLGITSKATDFAPEVGFMIILN